MYEPYEQVKGVALSMERSFQAILITLGIAATLNGEVALAAELRPEQLVGMSLEQLSEVEITSVSGYAEPLLHAAASIFVISNEDIRRSGAASLPEALRLAPNVEVAQISAHTYAISVRGLNGASNKLLVLIDGRIVYTPLYSGVIWYAQDVLLEDVDRIEVISGPGGTQWGSNAVNGVINVITRASGATAGGLLVGAGGNREYRAAMRFDGTFEGGGYRVYAKAFEIDNTETSNGTSANDGWKRAQIGFKVDWADGLTVQGDAYRGELADVNPGRGEFSGANLLMNWEHHLANGDVIGLRGYLDQTELELTAAPRHGTFRQRLNIADVEFQHRLHQRAGHAITWGGGYRLARDHLSNFTTIAYLPERLDLHWANLFLQDQFSISPATTLTAGVKFERNSYTGVEVLPSIRLAWAPVANHLVWGAVSRAVRTPSRLDRDLYSPMTPPFFIAGGPDFRSETSDVFEIGYRAQPLSSLSYSVTAYVHEYDHLRSVEVIDGRYLVVGNKMHGKSTGIEAWGAWEVSKQWLLRAGVAWLDQDLKMRPDSTDPTGISAAGNDPDVHWMLRSSWNLPNQTELEIGVRYVGSLPAPAVPAYTAVDMRLGWRPRPDVDVSIVARNLLDAEHIEFGAPGSASVIPRSVFLNVRWDI